LGQLCKLAEISCPQGLRFSGFNSIADVKGSGLCKRPNGDRLRHCDLRLRFDHHDGLDETKALVELAVI
jgi:hypothetical protein